MSLQDWGLAVTAVVALLTAIWTGVKTLSDRRAGVTATERSLRRDTVADRDTFIDQLQEELRDARTGKAESDQRAAVSAADLTAEREYSQALIDHIYRQKPPPPPQRPPRG